MIDEALFKGEEAKRKLKDLVEYKHINLNNVVVSFSGGKDSTLMLKLVEELGWKNKVKVVFMNTYMELKPTIEFIELIKKSGGNVYETKPKNALPLIYKKYGLPFHSKHTSEMIYRLQLHNFDFKNDIYKTYEELRTKYKNCDGAIKGLTNQNITFNCAKGIKRFLYENGDSFKIANKCCDFVKKKPVKQFLKDVKAELCLVGVRASESQTRKAKYKSCYAEKTELKYFYPLLFLNDEEVLELIKFFDLEISKAYTEGKLQRTGCFCCPFGKNGEQELELLKKHEPNKYQASLKLYGSVFEAYKKYRS